MSSFFAQGLRGPLDYLPPDELDVESRVAVDRHISQVMISDSIWVVGVAKNGVSWPGRNLVAVFVHPDSSDTRIHPGRHEHGQTHTGLNLKNPSESVTASGVGKTWK